MFNHLKVLSIKGLKECYLLSLGKINIVCGKNNSGKSTILEGIDKYRIRGIRTVLLSVTAAQR